MKKMTFGKILCCVIVIMLMLVGCGNDDVVMEFTNPDTATNPAEYVVEETLIEEYTVEMT